MNQNTSTKPFKSLMRTLAVSGAATIMAGTVIILGMFYALA